MPAGPLHFLVRALQYIYTPTGYFIRAYTTRPCHLWLRWTNIVPQKHVNKRMVRGAPIGTYIDQCFVVFTDLEQSEFGDTYIHEFTMEPWPACERRWFYFWGTVTGLLSPSASPIFTKHRPFKWVIYSDPGTGLVTVDGRVERWTGGLSWANTHDGPGTSASPAHQTLYADIMSSDVRGMWTRINRSIMTFDLGGIPPDHEIVEANFNIYVEEKQKTHLHYPAWAIYQAFPNADNDLQPPDYNNTTPWICSGAIPYYEIHVGMFNTFNFNEYGCSILKAGRVAKLALREVTYDAANEAPWWARGIVIRLHGASVDTPFPARKPYLVAYSSPKEV